ncbi:MAG: ankyrin repeat domain-containing protein [Planctomycetia bacterium]|nr:ankyrin repeat domain-containing protein [Planctomycetia bacterium]
MTQPTSPQDDAELTRLLSAIYAGDTPGVAQILAQKPELARAASADGQTPLHAAAQCNDPTLGALLLAQGADAEAKFGASGHTALSWAVTCHAMEFARALVRLGVKPDLFCAAGIGSLEHVQACFDDAGKLVAGASRTGSSRFAADGTRLPCPPWSATEKISDALSIACRTGQTEVVRFLLTKQPDLSFRAYQGGTALHWAYFGGSREAIELLERAGADAAARDDVLHCTPRAFGICVAANSGFPNLVQQRLAEDPALVNFYDGQTTPLHAAARGGNLEVVRMLLDAGADPALRDADGKTALEVATEAGHVWVVEMLRGAEGG